MAIRGQSIILLAVAAFVLLVGVFYGISYKKTFWGLFLEKVKEGKKIVYFNELTDFDWDTVCVLEPYSLGSDVNREKRIKEYIKGDLGAFENKLPDLNDDSSWAFAFVRNGVVVEVLQKGRSGHLYKGYNINCLGRNDAYFFAEGDKIFIRATQGGE